VRKVIYGLNLARTADGSLDSCFLSALEEAGLVPSRSKLKISCVYDEGTLGFIPDLFLAPGIRPQVESEATIFVLVASATTRALSLAKAATKDIGSLCPFGARCDALFLSTPW